MTTQRLLDPAGDPTAHIHIDREREPVRVVGSFIGRRFDSAVDRLAFNITTLLLTYDGFLVALDDDVDAETEV